MRSYVVHPLILSRDFQTEARQIAGVSIVQGVAEDNLYIEQEVGSRL
jgi:hypothetical protein